MTCALSFLSFLSRLRRLAPLPLLAAAAWAAPAWAGPSVPFKASVSAQETLGYDPVRCPVTGVVGTTTGTGTASHLGKVQMVAQDCPLLAPGVLPTFGNGVLTLTASNGDELRASYHGALYPVPGSANEYSISGYFNVTGGSGRFAGATGSGSLQGSITLGATVSKAEYQVAGTLSY